MRARVEVVFAAVTATQRSEMTVLVGDRFIVHWGKWRRGRGRQTGHGPDRSQRAGQGDWQLTRSRRTLALHSASVRNPLRLSKSWPIF